MVLLGLSLPTCVHYSEELEPFRFLGNENKIVFTNSFAYVLIAMFAGNGHEGNEENIFGYQIHWNTISKETMINLKAMYLLKLVLNSS